MKTFRNLVLISAFSLLFFYSGYQFGKRGISVSFNKFKPKVSIVNRQVPATKDLDFSLFWDVWSRLERFYVDKSKLDPQKMFYGAIAGMVASIGDPYTVFLDPKQNKESKEELAGQFEGVGIQLGLKDKKIVVIAPLKDTPADKAGIKSGDFIVKVDGKETAGWTLPEAVSKIRGPKGTKVTLTIVRGEEKPKDFVLTRETIYVKSVELNFKEATFSAKSQEKIVEKKKPEEIAYLKLSRFGDETNKEWEKAVSEISDNWERGKIKGLILDLRDNPGGYLNGAVFIASEFLENGIVVQQELASGEKQTYSVSRKGKLTKIPLVVLINKGSASASEIVAGALRDYKRATLVGEKTFGKGSIQEAQELPGGAGLHVTTAKWLLPKGEWINGKGIEPDVKIENDEKKPDTDLQLEKAREILNKQISK